MAVHIFGDKARAEAFAKKKNKRVRKGKWVVQKKDGGWVAWHKKTPGATLL